MARLRMMDRARVNQFPAVLLAAVLVAAPACHRADKKTDQLAALDGAYQSGLLTKDEYDAKRRALTGGEPAPVATPAPAPNPVPAPAAAPEPAPVPAAAPPAKVAPQAKPAPKPRPFGPPVASLVTPSSPPIAPSAPPPIESAPAPATPSVAETKEPEPAPLAGCDDAEFKSGGQKGAEERFFAAPPEQVRRAALSALDSLDFNIHKDTSKEIEASKKRNIGVIVGAGGERVILTFQKAESGGHSGTLLIARTKKSFVGRVTQRTWTDAVLAQTACKLRESNR